MVTLQRSAAAFAVMLLAGCGSTEKPPVAPTGGVDQETQKPMASSSEKTSDNPTRSQVAISDEIRRACGLTDEDAYFAFDSAQVHERDRTILGSVARCFVSGPLAGKRMELVGHADPRGDSEYNMVLGGRRADNVKNVVVSVGMPTARVSSTSRGALDAKGTDEASWVKDRRVDVLVGG